VVLDWYASYPNVALVEAQAVAGNFTGFIHERRDLYGIF
jgi:hypothetical protein